MQMHKRNTHSKGASNLAVNRAHKRAKIYTGPNRAARRLEADVKGRYSEEQAAIVEANLVRQRQEANNIANNDMSIPV